MRYIDMSGGGGQAWDNYAKRKTKEKGRIPHYGDEGPIEHKGLREALAQRQGFLCGFCMGHLDCHDKDGKLTWSNVKVAHLEAQSLSEKQKKKFSPADLKVEMERRRQRGLDHRNMVMACQGVSPGVKYCDAHQKERHVTIAFDNQGLMAQVTFTPVQVLDEATVFSPKPTKTQSGLLVQGPWQAQIGAPEARDDDNSLLNLNNGFLCRQRRRALDNFFGQFKPADWNPKNYHSWIKTYSTPDENGRLPAYCQVVVRALEKKLKQHPQ